ncbi:MAG: ABC transporter ATP-binding protein [Candidatus Thorarchaeota archaeon]|nr:ABC transporter ATP-binding protein [Candidatus Thorarchaeota archaeon]
MDDVVISHLTKNFGELIAVNDMVLDVPAGSIFGLLGPNGAGKSTTTRILSTLLRPTSGTAVVAGFDIHEDPVKIREITGVLPEEANHTVYEGMTAYENLEYFAKLYGVVEEAIEPAIQELLEFMELWDRKDDLAGELSTGNRQRLALCRALLHKPTVLLLDEPTAALDPVAAKRVRELILSLSEKYNQTFFINSHNLAEVQRMCNKIAIIDEGRILLAGNTEELRSQLRGKQKYRLLIRGNISSAESVVVNLDFVKSHESEVDTIILEIENPMDNNVKLLRTLLDAGVNVVELSEDEATLEDLYLEVVKGGSQQ